MSGPAALGASDGKVALVTRRRLRHWSARSYRIWRAGAAVVIADPDLAGAESTALEATDGGGRAFAQMADVTDGDQVEQLVATAVERFERLDRAFNNRAWPASAEYIGSTLAPCRRILVPDPRNEHLFGGP